jgi:riboflavin biosynthesis pyrimidine reductase
LASTPPEPPARSLFTVLAEEETAEPRTALEREYGAALRLSSNRTAVNFVSSIDGIVSFGLRSEDSRAVGGGVAADRLLMAMLRAVAGVIVVGAGTLRATLNHQWTATELAPGCADDLAELRAASGRPPGPAPLLVVSGSGDIPLQAQAVARPAVPVHVLTASGVETPELVAARVGSRTRAPGDPTAGSLDASVILAAARGLAGGGPVLCEGGPHLLGNLLAGAVPIDLFLTVAPQLAGRSTASTARLGLVEGVELAAFARRGVLRSARRASSHLLLRYAIDPPEPG